MAQVARNPLTRGQVRRSNSRRGQIVPLFALMLVAMLGVAGLVVDIGGAWGQDRTQQKVADTAALAGATRVANGALRAEVIQAAIDFAVANGFAASEVSVNIPPTQGAYAPGGSLSGPLSSNDCSTAAARPCWVEVVVNRPHQNSFAGVLGMPTFGVTSRGVAVAGIANAVTNGIAPIMFNYRAVQSSTSGSTKVYCSPQQSHCSPATTFPLTVTQFNWTTFCTSNANCNVNAADAKDIINGGGIQTVVELGMYLGPHNNGNPNSVCKALKDLYPTGADLPVAINDDNGKLVGFWVWHFDPTLTDCTGITDISGSFVEDITDTLPLTISAGGAAATFGQYVVRLVE